MEEEIFSLAQALTPVDGEERETLRYFCAQAEGELRGRLRPGVTAEDCPGFLPGAAWLALSYLMDARGTGRIRRFSAGDLSVERESGGDGKALRALSRRAMAGYAVDEGFAFRGVRS